MKSTLLTLCVAVLAASGASAQTFVNEQFDGTSPELSSDGPGYAVTQGNGNVTITGDGSGGAFTAVRYNVPGAPLDVSSNPKVFVRARSSAAMTTLRLDLVDNQPNAFGGDGRVSNRGNDTGDDGRSVTLTSDFAVYTFDFTATDFAAATGYGWCPPGAGDPCSFDVTMLTQLAFYANPQTGGFDGAIDIDYVTIGDNANAGGGGGGGGPAVYTDPLTDDGGFGFVAGSYSKTSGNGEVNIVVNNNGGFENFGYGFRDANGDPAPVDFTAGNNQLFFRARATSPVSLRIDLNDAAGRQTNVNTDPRNVQLTTEYQDIVIDYSNELNYWAYGTSATTPCSPGPDFDQPTCPVNASAIRDLFMYVNSGTGGYNGTITFDYIAVGAAPNTTLPVSLASFDAAAVTAGVELEWVTASEQDNAFFAVEMSRDGASFQEVGTVEGAGTTQSATAYDFTHYTTEAGTYYFRLAQYDFDGTADRSQVITAQVGAAGTGFVVVGTYANDELTVDTDFDTEVTVLDLRGAVLAKAQLTAGRHAVDVSHLPAGHYVVTDGQHAVRFVK